MTEELEKAARATAEKVRAYLTPQALESLKDNGFLHLKAAIPAPLIARAL